MAACDYQSGHENMRQYEGGGVIKKNYQDLFDMSENEVSVDESQEDKGKPEGGGVVSTQNGITIDLTLTSASDPMSVGNNYDELVLTRAPIDTPKTHSQPSADT